MLKRGYQGTYHKISPKHLQCYVNEFAGRHGIRDQDTIDQMTAGGRDGREAPQVSGPGRRLIDSRSQFC